MCATPTPRSPRASETVLIIHGESGRSGVGRTRNVVAPTSLAGQFEQPYRPLRRPTLFMIPVLRYMKTWPDARATGDGLGHPARMGGQEPARDPRAAGPDGPSRGRQSLSRTF